MHSWQSFYPVPCPFQHCHSSLEWSAFQYSRVCKPKVAALKRYYCTDYWYYKGRIVKKEIPIISREPLPHLLTIGWTVGITERRWVLFAFDILCRACSSTRSRQVFNGGTWTPHRDWCPGPSWWHYSTTCSPCPDADLPIALQARNASTLI